MIAGQVKIYTEFDGRKDQLEVYIFIHGDDGRRYIVKPVKLEFEERKEGEGIIVPNEPTLIFSGPFLNQIRGLRTQLEKFSTEHVEEKELSAAEVIEAKDLHLNDMRKLVSSKLGVKLIGD